MRALRLGTVSCALLGAALSAAPAFSQYGQFGTTTTTEPQPNNYPPALPARRTPPPRYVFEPLGEIALPGPLGEAPASVDGETVAVPVEGGIARVAAELGATPAVAPGVPVETSEWEISPDGKHRYRTTAEGIVESQRKTRLKGRWVRRWKIVAPNSFVAPPVLVGPRLCYAGLDDMVTCVRASNGHRLWSVDLGDRISRPIAKWPPGGTATGRSPNSDASVEGGLLLIVPDSGATIVALDAYDGSRVATYDLPAQGRFASSALVLPEGGIALARKGYDDAEAALVLLKLAPAPKGNPPAKVPYNGRSPQPAGSAGR